MTGMNLGTKDQPSAAGFAEESAQHFAQHHLLPNSARWARGLFEPKALFEAAGSAGMLGLQVPHELGGQALSFRDKVIVLETLARADFCAAMALVNSHNVAVQLAKCSPDILTPLYVAGLLSGGSVACTALTEPGTGSD